MPPVTTMVITVIRRKVGKTILTRARHDLRPDMRGPQRASPLPMRLGHSGGAGGGVTNSVRSSSGGGVMPKLAIQKYIDCAEAGMTQAEAARFLGVSRQRVWASASRHGIVFVVHRAETPSQSTIYNRAWQEKNPEKRAAHKAVEYHKLIGNLKQQDCEVCGRQNTHAHHDDYSKPLDVRWLCPACHKREHSSHSGNPIRRPYSQAATGAAGSLEAPTNSLTSTTRPASSWHPAFF
jgi:ribosomal protein S27AE